MFLRTPLLCLSVAIACGQAGQTNTDSSASLERIALYVGNDVSPTVAARFEDLLARVSPVTVVRDAPAVDANTLVLSIGNTSQAAQLVDESELSALGPEGYLIRSATIDGVMTVAADGNPGDPVVGEGSLGDHYAAYALLEELGFGFLHPLDPVVPSEARLDALRRLERTESPYWRIRGMQIHTMHPLELTNVLNGWGKTGPDDHEGWQAMLVDWHRTCEWLVANRQNRVHWVLLWSAEWAQFADSAERQQRLSRVVDIAHQYGLLVGVDTPISLKQQNSYRLIHDADGEQDEQLTEMRRRIDWVMGAGFDYLASENGTSEFTHSADVDMMAWMDELARYLDEEHGGRRAYMKIHASQGQEAEDYLDPESGEPLNINFLPYYSDARLGVMPHTVQHYGLDDSAPTYGNENFGFIRDYLQREVGRREVVWHPETAYWVSFDIDVPLFLPLYAERRFHDLRLLADDEQSGRMGRGENAGGRMDGQIVFSSGWEWGYWLGDVVAARAAWDPQLDIAGERDALVALLTDALSPAGEGARDLAEALVEISYSQKEVLIDGIVAGTAPLDVELRNGQAYLQGHETWDEIAKIVETLTGKKVDTQPRKLGLVDMRNPLNGGPDYETEIKPLLAELERLTAAHHQRISQLSGRLSENFRPLFDDLEATAKITELRARQVHGLYDYVDGYGDSSSNRQERIATARAALDEATELVIARESRYRVEADRVASWSTNPTVYDYGYLWTVRSLHYWWRDEGKAYDVPMSPCYLNTVSPAEVGFGEGIYVDAADAAYDALAFIGVTAVSDCLSAPAAEPVYPAPGMRP